MYEQHTIHYTEKRFKEETNVSSNFSFPVHWGGGILVLKYIHNQQNNTATSFTYDLSYGGLFCLSRQGHYYSVRCGNLFVDSYQASSFLVYSSTTLST